jgi:hypothetical protein
VQGGEESIDALDAHAEAHQWRELVDVAGLLQQIGLLPEGAPA